MKKLVSNILNVLLVSSFVLGAFSGCKTQGGDSSSEQPEVIEKFEPIIYKDNGENIADYSIVISKSADKATVYGAESLQKRIKQAVGAQLPIVTDDTAEGECEIILGTTTRKACAEIDFDALGSESFQVKSVDNDLVIAGNDRGLLYGVYAYLEAIGFRFYTPKTEKIPYGDDVFIPEDMNLTWTPTFNYREAMYYSAWDADWAVSQRINSDFQRDDLKNNEKYGGFAGYIGGGSWLVHTFNLLMDESYFTV